MPGRSDRAHPLFVLVAVAAATAVVAGVTADAAVRPVWALADNRIYRGEIALVTFALLYAVSVVLWLAAHGLTLESIVAGPASAQIPQVVDRQALRSLDELRALAAEVDRAVASARDGLAAHEERLVRVERSLTGRQTAGEDQPRR